MYTLQARVFFWPVKCEVERTRRGSCLCVFPRFHRGIPRVAAVFPSPQEMTRCVSGWWICRARAAERGGTHSEHHLLWFPHTWNWESRDYFPKNKQSETNISLIACNGIVLRCTCFSPLFVSCCAMRNRTSHSDVESGNTLIMIGWI